MEKELGLGDGGFRDAVFTAGETAYCQGMRYPAQHFAARFAGKEAVLKALAAAGVHTRAWVRMEIVHDAQGVPRVVLHGEVREAAEARGIEAVFLTLSHTRELAMAWAVAVGRSVGDPGAEKGRG